jgi:hypothetical protein
MGVPLEQPFRRRSVLHPLRILRLARDPPLTLVRRLEVRTSFRRPSRRVLTPRPSHSSYTDTAEFQSAVAQFMYAFFITVFLFLVAAHRSSGGLVLALGLIDLALLFIGLCAFSLPPLLERC